MTTPTFNDESLINFAVMIIDLKSSRFIYTCQPSQVFRKISFYLCIPNFAKSWILKVQIDTWQRAIYKLTKARWKVI